MKGREPYLTMKEAAVLSLIYNAFPVKKGLRDLKLEADGSNNDTHLVQRLEKNGLIKSLGMIDTPNYQKGTNTYSLTSEGLRSLHKWGGLALQVLAITGNSPVVVPRKKKTIERVATNATVIEAKSAANIKPSAIKDLSESIAEEIISIRNNEDNSAKSKKPSKKHHTSPSRRNNPEFDVLV